MPAVQECDDLAHAVRLREPGEHGGEASGTTIATSTSGRQAGHMPAAPGGKRDGD
ncbi:hypothetical protein ABZ646_47090 [Streptomyces sp. NPDC007162]|uniref:hypothetical protein n=1 Tax=Streptomyces sp. NPDC007162 TaxID=3156917 RepID=UPI0033D69FB7